MYLAHPQLPACEDCKAWFYDLKTGERESRGGKPIPRPPGIPLPCFQCPKLSADDRRHDPRPEKACEITPRMKTCFSYFRMCEADRRGMIPMDILTLENNAICKMAEYDARLFNQQQQPTIVPVVVPGGSGQPAGR